MNADTEPRLRSGLHLSAFEPAIGKWFAKRNSTISRSQVRTSIQDHQKFWLLKLGLLGGSSNISTWLLLHPTWMRYWQHACQSTTRYDYASIPSSPCHVPGFCPCLDSAPQQGWCATICGSAQMVPCCTACHAWHTEVLSSSNTITRCWHCAAAGA
jgi:hypothetical protein